MTDTDRNELEKEIVWQREKAKKDLSALEVKVEQIAVALEKISLALRKQPELVTDIPALSAACDLRDDIKFLDREVVIATCRDLVKAKKSLSSAEKQLNKLRLGSPQTRIDIGEVESENELA
jgi:hypothetical protein